MTDLPNLDDLPELTPEDKASINECDICWEVALPQDSIPCDLWRVVSIRAGSVCDSRLSEWYASETRVTAALERIKAEGYELVSVTKYRQVAE